MCQLKRSLVLHHTGPNIDRGSDTGLRTPGTCLEHAQVPFPSSSPPLPGSESHFDSPRYFWVQNAPSALFLTPLEVKVSGRQALSDGYTGF
jgi:hypothetical protein